MVVRLRALWTTLVRVDEVICTHRETCYSLVNVSGLAMMQLVDDRSHCETVERTLGSTVIRIFPMRELKKLSTPLNLKRY